MLWIANHPFQSMIDAPSDLVSARKVMIAEIREHPERFVTKMLPAEPSASTLLDLGRRAFGFKT